MPLLPRSKSRTATAAGGPALDALDAGCGRKSALGQYRARIRRLVGADVHRPPDGALPNLDDFLEVDLCGPSSAIADGSFDVVLSSFTVEHFTDPSMAFRNLRRWLRPDGQIVLTTVNRRHPAVALYLGLPARIQRTPMQRALKASAADAHPLVGICNNPATLTSALDGAGFEDVRVVAVPNLARAWGRHLPFFVLGLIADLAARPFASRRSTLVADARVPSTSGVAVARASFRPRRDARAGRRAEAAGSTGSSGDFERVPPERRGRTLRRIVAFFRPYRGQVAIVLGAILLTSFVGLVNPILLKLLIDIAIPQRDWGLLNLFVGLMIVLPIVSGLIGVGQSYLNNIIGQSVMHDLRTALYAHLQKMPLRFFTETKTGEIQSRLANDVGGVQSVVTDTAASLTSNIAIALAP